MCGICFSFLSWCVCVCVTPAFVSSFRPPILPNCCASLFILPQSSLCVRPRHLVFLLFSAPFYCHSPPFLPRRANHDSDNVRNILVDVSRTCRILFVCFFFSSLIFFRVPDFILSGSSPAKINNLTNLWWRWLVWRFSLHSWSHRNKKWREPNESRRILFVSSSSACLHSSLSCVNLFHGKNLSPPPANESGAHFRCH